MTDNNAFHPSAGLAFARSPAGECERWESDVEARAIMREAWDANQSKELAQIEIVDIKPRAELETTWAPFFVRDHYGVAATLTRLFWHARRTCDHFAMATFQNSPCHDTPLPETQSLAELHAWAEGMIREEIELRDHGHTIAMLAGDRPTQLNNTYDRTAGSHSLAAAGQRER